MFVRSALAAVALLATAACANTDPPAAQDASATAPATELVTTIEPEAERPVVPGEPVRLAIPAIGVDATVVPVRSDDGSLDPPADPKLVGWWAEGVRPGSSTGAALLTAHTVHTGGGAFDDLDELDPADDVTVSTRTGTLRYDVEQVATYSKAELAERAADLFAQDGPARLVLVTCDDWDGSRYLSNTVVVLRSA